MKRGEIWTVSGGKDYVGKPRPVLIIQDDSFEATASVTICAFTTDDTDAPLFRILIEANEQNGLNADSRLMIDKITTVPKSKMGLLVGKINNEDLVRINQSIIVFLGLSTPTRIRRG